MFAIRMTDHMPLLFCFRCASPMLRGAHDEIYCASGDMGLSKVLEDQLMERFGAALRPLAPPPAPGAQWYCPACRIP
ncbi:MAG: hypothetical protein ABI551_03435, partial [Polyangiaceae bacterium]